MAATENTNDLNESTVWALVRKELQHRQEIDAARKARTSDRQHWKSLGIELGDSFDADWAGDPHIPAGAKPVDAFRLDPIPDFLSRRRETGAESPDGLFLPQRPLWTSPAAGVAPRTPPSSVGHSHFAGSRVVPRDRDPASDDAVAEIRRRVAFLLREAWAVLGWACACLIFAGSMYAVIFAMMVIGPR